MRIGILPDIHLGYGDPEAVMSELDAVVSRFNETIEPDHVIVLGDVIEDGPSAVADEDNYSAVVTVLRELSAPVTYVRGNHDVMNLSPQDLNSLTGHGPFGRIDEFPLIYLDSSAPRLADPRGELSDEQLGYLDTVLPTVDRAVLFVHHPIHYHDIRDNEWFGEQPEQAFCGNKTAVHNRLEHHDIQIAVVNAHLHETDYTRYRGVDHFSLNALNKTRRAETTVTGTYGVLTLTNQLELEVTDQTGYTWTVTLPLVES